MANYFYSDTKKWETDPLEEHFKYSSYLMIHWEINTQTKV